MSYFSVHLAKIQRPHSLPELPEKEMGGRWETFFTFATELSAFLSGELVKFFLCFAEHEVSLQSL